MRLTVCTIAILVVFSACKTGYQVRSSEMTEYVFSDTAINQPDSSVLEFIRPYREKMEKEMSEVIAESNLPMEKTAPKNPESLLGDFVADACMSESEKILATEKNPIDMAVFNNGGLRSSLPKGKITRGNVFELMPFENELVVLTLDGQTVKKIFNFIASKNGAPISGARFEIKEKEAINIKIRDLSLDTTKTYRILTSDYLANGGDSFSFLVNSKSEKVNLKMREAIMQYMIASYKKDGILNPKTDGRIIYAK